MCSKNKYFKTKILFLLIWIAGSQLGCKKFIEIDAPNTSVNQENVFTKNSNAISAVTGIYTRMSSTYFSLNLSVYPDLSADNLTLYDLNNLYAILYYQNALNSKYLSDPSILWNDLYSYIYACNGAIEGLTQKNGVSEDVKQRLLGEVYFLRGFYYFYLINLYQNVPLVLTTDFTKSSTLTNESAANAYNQIIADLQQAQTLLDPSYRDGTIKGESVERVRPNSMTATALLARVYLYTKNYTKAEDEATKIINNNTYSLSAINSVFQKSSAEIIWALQSVAFNINTQEGNFYIYAPDGPNTINYTYLSNDLISKIEKGDLRETSWISYFDLDGTKYPYPTKYKIKNGDPSTSTEYTVVFRLGEQYLIRAEARIQQGKLAQGISDLNIIRQRARAEATVDIPNPLPDIKTNITKEQGLDAIFKERRIELFTEWGNRWFDLKRTGKINEVMTLASVVKGSKWDTYQSLYPIPLTDLQANVNLKQNPGYK
jgi:hypothetical protein